MDQTYVDTRARRQHAEAAPTDLQEDSYKEDMHIKRVKDVMVGMAQKDSYVRLCPKSGYVWFDC